MDSYRIEQIAKQLPGSWNELKLKDFYKLYSLKITEKDEFDDLFVGVDNTYSVITTLSDATVEELDEIANLSPLIAKKVFDKVVFFYNSLPDEKQKPTLQVKSIDEISYNDFVLFQLFQSKPLENLHLFIKSFTKDKLTDEEVMNVSTEEAYRVFFFVANSVKKYIKSSQRSLKRKLIKQKAKKLFNKILYKQS